MELTAHTVQRCSQRGTRKLQAEWLIDFGCHAWSWGVKVYFFDRPHFHRFLLRISAANRQLAEKTRNSYVVASDHKLITVGHRQAVVCPSKPGAHLQRRLDWRHGEACAALSWLKAEQSYK